MSRVPNVAVYAQLCALESRIVMLEAERADDRIRISQLEAEIAELRGKVSAVETAERFGVVWERLGILSTHMRSMFGKTITSLEGYSKRLRDVETLNQEKGLRLQRLEEDVAVLKGEAPGCKRARCSAGGY